MSSAPHFSGQNLAEFIECTAPKEGLNMSQNTNLSLHARSSSPFTPKSLSCATASTAGKSPAILSSILPPNIPTLWSLNPNGNRPPDRSMKSFPIWSKNIKKQYPYKTLIVIDGGGVQAQSLGMDEKTSGR